MLEGPANLDRLVRDSLSGEVVFEMLLKDIQKVAMQRSGLLQMLQDPFV